MIDERCSDDCGSTGWRFCPGCGRRLAPGHGGRDRPRKPTLEELLALRDEGRSWKRIGALFGYASGGPVQSVLNDAMGGWYHRTKRLLVEAYEADGGALRPQPYPQHPRDRYRFDGGPPPTVEDIARHRQAVDACQEANARWEAATGLERLDEWWSRPDAWLRAAFAGTLPGPVPRWPVAP